MSKHKIGDKTKHSRWGVGEITGMVTEKRKPPEIDREALTRRRFSLMSDITEIERQLAAPTEPYTVQMYEVTFSDSRQADADAGVAKVERKERYDADAIEWQKENLAKAD